jgi:glycosyltransferase involved in cell wall biosynthesis
MTDLCANTKEIRVLHIGKFYPPYAGGIENFMGDLLPALERSGVRSGALIHAHESTTSASPDERPEHHASEKIWRVPCLGNLLYTPISPAFPLWLSRTIKEFRPQILHIHLPNVSPFWALALPAARKIPWVIHWHSDVVPSRIDKRMMLAYNFYRPFEQKLLAKSKAIIATSTPYLESSKPLQSWHDKAHVIPLGLNPERLPLPDEETRIWAEKLWGETKFRILSVGRLTYYKGHEILIRAMEKLEDSKALIVGKGERHDKLASLISSLGFKDKVSLAGEQPDKKLLALLATCDCFCLPSVERTEAFGLVLPEALRFGVPLVVSDIPGSGVGWVVENEKTGFLVPPGNVDGLAAALTKLKDNPEIRAMMCAAGKESFRKRFHIDSVAEKTIELYRQLVD